MVIRDYKAKETYRKLGLKRGRAAIRREVPSLTPRRVFLWVGLCGLIIFVNYLFFVYLGPLNEKKVKSRQPLKVNGQSNTYYEEWFNKGSERYQAGDFSGAVRAYSEAVILMPEKTEPYFNRGIAYIKMGELDKALHDYSKVIRLNPDYAKAYNNRGWAYLQRGLFDLAIQDCTQALLLDPAMATAYHTRGMAYKGKGLTDRAGDDFQKSCKLGDINGCQAYRQLTTAKRGGR
jgi:tetratricopeptide (TPR) repeat protein